MSQTFEVKLGGRTWQLPRLPFRVVRAVQPGLLRQATRISEGDPNRIAYRLDEKTLSDQSRLVALALSVVDPEVNTDSLEAMVFTATDLALACISVLQACGLQIGQAAPEAGESIVDAAAEAP